MDNNYKSLLTNYLDLEGDIKSVFFNANNEDELNIFLESFINKKYKEDKLFINRKIKDSLSSYLLSPYYPFLDILYEKHKNKDKKEIKEILNNCDVYHFQKSCFLNYFLGKLSYREEKILLSHIEYEKKELYKSLLNLLINISDEHNNIIFNISSLHFAKKSTYDFIRYLLNYKRKIDKNIIFIFSFFNLHSFFDDEEKKVWESFFAVIKKKGFNINFNRLIKMNNEGEKNKDINISKFLKNELSVVKKNENEIINKEIKNIEKDIITSSDAINFLAYDEAKKNILYLNEHIRNNNLKIDKSKKFLLLNLLGDVFLYFDEYDQSLIHYNSLLNYAQIDDNNYQIANAYYKISYANYFKNNIEACMRFSKLSIKLLEEIKEEKYKKLYFYCYYIIYRALEYLPNLRNTLSQSFKIVEELSRKNKFYNHLSTLYSHFSTTFLSSINIEERLSLCKTALKISKRCKNYFMLADLYHSIGTIYSFIPEFDKTIIYYKKSEKMMKKLGVSIEIVFIYNGLGYTYFVNENYNYAYKYYKKAVLTLNKIKNYDELALTLLNIGILFLFNFDYKNAKKNIEYVLVIMDLLSLKTLPYHTIYNIYSLLGIVNIKLNKFKNALEYFNKINYDNLANDEEIFYYNFLKTLIYKYEKKYKKCEESFINLYIIINHTSNVKRVFHPRLYYEYGLFLKEINEMKKSEETFEKGIKIAEKMNYTMNKYRLLEEKSKLSNLEISENEKNIYKTYINKYLFKIKEFEFDFIIEAIKLKGSLNKLHKKINEINFLNQLRKILSRAYEKEDIIEESMHLIHNNFIMDLSYLFLYENIDEENYDNKKNEILDNINTFKNNSKMYYNNNKTNKSNKVYKCYYSSIPIKNLKFNLNALLKQLDENNLSELHISNFDDMAFKGFFPDNLIFNISSLIKIPILGQNLILGDVFFATFKKDLVLTDDDFRVLSIAISQIRISLEKNKLDKQVQKTTSKLLEKTYQLEKANEIEKEKTLALARAKLALEETYKTIKKDLYMAKRVQENILPKNFDKLGGFNFTIKYLPMSDVGGDLYDISILEDGTLRVFLADATGHGVQAALLTMIIKSEYEKKKFNFPSTAKLLEELNNDFFHTYNALVLFFTCIVVDINLDKKTLKYSSAGHTNQFIINKDEITYLSSTGRMLGTHEDNKYKEITYDYNYEKLLLFTDGIFEEFNKSGEEFGESRLTDFVMKNISLPVNILIEKILDELDNFIDGNEVNDDITIIGISI
jgi:serine phosphatase RsbU (regulator of sigma subunit)